MRRTIFTTSLLSALSCLCTQGYSQVGIKPIADQSLIGQATDNARNAAGNSLQQSADQLRGTGNNANVQANAQLQPNAQQPNTQQPNTQQPNTQGSVGAQSNVTGQVLQNQANAQLQGNVNGLNAQSGSSQIGINSQAGRANAQVGVNGQAGVTSPNIANAGAQQRAGQYPQNQYGQNQFGQNQYGQNQYGQNQYGQNQYGQNQYGQNQYPQNQGTQAWQSGSQSQMTGGGNMMPNGSMMAGGMQSSGPVYLLQHESSGREFICVNGSRVYFDQPGMNQTKGTNQFDSNTGAVQDQRRAGYGNYDQATNLQSPQQPAQAVDPKMNKDATADPIKADAAKSEEGTAKPSADTKTEADSATNAPTLK